MVIQYKVDSLIVELNLIVIITNINEILIELWVYND